jgi:hypothetical protein
MTSPDDIRAVIEKARSFPEVTAEDIAAAEAALAESSESVPSSLREEARAEAPSSPAPVTGPESEVAKDIRAQLADMTMPQKIKLALFGNSVCRGLLILDPNRMVQQFVLKNPKLQQNEVEAFARNTQMAEGVLRAIADSNTWMKSGSLRYSIVSNPKTPGDVALKWLRYLPVADLRKIAKSKNLPQLIAVTAKKRLAEMDKK